jgi:hypothetical protein
MAYMTLAARAAGDAILASDQNIIAANFTELRATRAAAVRRDMTNTNTFTNQTSYADFPGVDDKPAMDLTFIKESGDTALLVSVHTSCNFASGSSQVLSVGLSIGGTDYDVSRFLFPTAAFRALFSGTRVITGVGAGSLAIKPRFRAAGASSVQFVSGDQVYYSVIEIRA